MEKSHDRSARAIRLHAERLAFATLLALAPSMGARSASAAPLPAAAAQARADEREPNPAELAKKLAEFEKSLGYQHGVVDLPGGEGFVAVPKSMHFIPAEGARRVLTDLWGNPPETGDRVLGMLVPVEPSLFSDQGWGVVIEYDGCGYVSDSDASSINYTELLASMQAGDEAQNAERRRLGFEAIHTAGWAEPPHYDADAHKIYWALDLKGDGSPEHTLNYCIRVLGREGVLLMNAVAPLDALEEIKRNTPTMLAAVNFKSGRGYADYVASTDRTAEYGLIGLVAGAAAVKTGLLKGLWLGILAFKKLIIVGVVALGGIVARVVRGGTGGADSVK